MSKTKPGSCTQQKPGSRGVAGGGPNRNFQRRLDRLVSAWEQGDRDGSNESSVVEEPDHGVVSNPGRRNRTPLTAKEVEAIQTARANGESVLSIAKRFNIHRMTVWEHTTQRRDRSDGDTQSDASSVTNSS